MLTHEDLQSKAPPPPEDLEVTDVSEEIDVPIDEDAPISSPVSLPPPTDAEEVAAAAAGYELTTVPPPEADVDSETTQEVPLSELEDASGMKPQPPPAPPRGTRRRLSAVPPPSARAIRTALRVSEDDSTRKRLWWEELFTDDFGSAINELSDAQIEREVNFIEGNLNLSPGSVVMDLGCGTGRHAVSLAQRGYTLLGYDLSHPSLTAAAELAQVTGQKVNFLQGDMRELSFESKFDAIFCWNATFGYFEEEKNLRVLQSIFTALKPGGSVLLDLVNRDFVIGQEPNSNWFEGDGCVCMDDMHVDFITSRLRVKRTVMMESGRTAECSYSIRMYALHEIGKMLHDIGFRVTRVSGDLGTPGVFFGAVSPRIIVQASKPSAH